MHAYMHTYIHEYIPCRVGLVVRVSASRNCLWGHALKRSPRIIRKSRVSYPGPGFLSSARWPSLPKKAL